MRHSARGFGFRYALGMALPATGFALVLYTAAQLIVAHVRGTVPPPPLMVQAAFAESPDEPAPAEPPPEQTSAQPSPGK